VRLVQADASPGPAGFRLLDAARILETLSRLRDRIFERFPESGLGRLAGDLVTLSGETVRLIEYCAAPTGPSGWAHRRSL
jgi:hypothetical protein